MNLTAREKADNAIKWIDELPNGKQAPWGKRNSLGDQNRGFCCLGYGCHVVGIFVEDKAITYERFKGAVGLLHYFGNFRVGCGYLFYGKYSLSRVNDKTRAGFKRISKLLRTKPHWMFESEVAELIEAHYEGQS